MNPYLLYTRDGRGWLVSANSSDVAISKVEKASGQAVSCWFIQMDAVNPRYLWNITRIE